MDGDYKSKQLPTINSTDETDDATNEDEPCIRPQNNTKRKSMESLNKTRDDPASEPLDVEKNAANAENNSNFNTIKANSSSKPRFKTVKFNPPTSKFEEWASHKTGLSRLGLMLLAFLLFALFALTLAILIMSLIWPSIPHALMFDVCRSPACLIASSEAIAKMNMSVPPCEDLREYSCGHWLASHNVPKDKDIWGMKQHMQFKHRESLRNMINTMPYPVDMENLQWRVKNIYDSCMSVGIVESEEDRPLKKIIQQLGGWHILKDFSVLSWEMSRTLIKLHSKYNVQPFLKIDVVPDAKDPTTVESVIQISPSSLGLPDRTYFYRLSDDKVVKAYKSFLKDIAVHFGATSDAATTFADDMFHFERRIAERYPSRPPDRAPNYRPTLAKLEEIAPSVPLRDILSGMFPDFRLSKKTEVVVTASDHLHNISRLFSSSDRSVMNDYMMLKLAVKYLPYLSKPFRDTLFEFNSKLFGIKEHKPRWEMCVETLQKFVGFGLEAMYESHGLDGDRKRKVVTDMFEHIRQTVRDAVLKSNNLPLHIQEHFLDKLDKLNVQVGLPPSMRHPTYYNDYYRSLTSIKHDFFSNIIYGVNFLAEEKQKRLISPSEEHRWMDVVSDGNLRVAYVPEINKVIVPMALLTSPYFNSHYPPSVLYGGLGSEIGLAILNSITGQGVFHSGDGLLLPTEHPLHTKTHECFIHHVETTPILEALRFTYQAMENSLVNTPHVHQPAMETLEDTQIFFVAYAQNLCTMRTPERQDVDTTTQKTKLDDHFILQTIMRKSKQFANTFSCERKVLKEECDSLI
uniref:Endothelin-converting enzyme 1 n=1 Tax=Lygus hesperus TaxID=30085 RepID=A0A146L141_LYGHE